MAFSVKADRASTTANAEFCIPTSIDMVRIDCRDFTPSSFGMTYPNVNPDVWRRKTEESSLKLPAVPSVCRMEDDDATMLPHINATNTTQTKGVNSEIPLAAFGNRRRIVHPIRTGNKITLSSFIKHYTPLGSYYLHS